MTTLQPGARRSTDTQMTDTLLASYPMRPSSTGTAAVPKLYLCTKMSVSKNNEQRGHKYTNSKLALSLALGLPRLSEWAALAPGLSPRPVFGAHDRRTLGARSAHAPQAVSLHAPRYFPLGAPQRSFRSCQTLLTCRKEWSGVEWSGTNAARGCKAVKPHTKHYR